MIFDLDTIAAAGALVWVTGRGVYRVRNVRILRRLLLLRSTVWWEAKGRVWSSDRLRDASSVVGRSPGIDSAVKSNPCPYVPRSY